MQMNDDEHKYVPTGSPVEVGLLKFLITDDIAVQEKLVERERNYKLMTMIPFNSERKKMTVAYRLPGEAGIVRVIVKGAPENIIPSCVSELDASNDIVDFEGAGEAGENYLEVTVSEQIAKLGQKPLSFAYRDFKQEDFEQLYQ
jgi:magnesium-transporting ATPase (P-type)